MLAMVGAGEWGFSKVEMDVLAPWHWDWRNTGKAATKAAKGSEVLLFGDSLLKFGALPKVMEARGGGRGYNLAIGMGQTPSSYFLLKRVLRSGQRPRAVVIDTAADLLATSPRSSWSLRQWPEMLGFQEVVDLAWSTGDAALVGRLGLAMASPTVRAREEVRGVVLGALRGDLNKRRGEAAQFWRNTRVNRGASVMGRASTVYDRAEAFERYFGGGRFVVDPVNARYLERFFELAEGEKIPVFWVLTPVMVEVQEACERSGFAAEQGAFVRELQAKFPGVTVVDARGSGYGAEAYGGDPVHLNAAGATVFSNDLAGVIGRCLEGREGARWVGPGRHRAREVDGGVEDMETSAKMIRRGEARARR